MMATLSRVTWVAPSTRMPQLGMFTTSTSLIATPTGSAPPSKPLIKMPVRLPSTPNPDADAPDAEMVSGTSLMGPDSTSWSAPGPMRCTALLTTMASSWGLASAQSWIVAPSDAAAIASLTHAKPWPPSRMWQPSSYWTSPPSSPSPPSFPSPEMSELSDFPPVSSHAARPVQVPNTKTKSESDGVRDMEVAPCVAACADLRSRSSLRHGPPIRSWWWHAGVMWLRFTTSGDHGIGKRPLPVDGPIVEEKRCRSPTRVSSLSHGWIG